MQQPDRSRHDLRLVPVAAAGWAGAWLGTGAGVRDRWSLIVLVAVTASVLGLLLIARHWRLVVAGAAAVSLAGTLGVGVLAAHRMTSGPVAELAADRAVIDAEVPRRLLDRVRPPAPTAAVARGKGRRG